MARFAAVSVHDTLPRRHHLFGGVLLLHATWASFSSRLRDFQTQLRQRHGALVSVSVENALPCRPQVSGERRVASCKGGPAFQAAQGPFRPSAGNDMAPFAAVSAQDTQQARKTRRRAVHRCLDNAVSHRATWASFPSRSRAFQPLRRQRHSAPRCSKRSRHAAVSPTGIRRARCCIVRRGPAFQAAQGPFSPSAGSRLAPFAAVSVQDTQ